MMAVEMREVDLKQFLEIEYKEFDYKEVREGGF